MKNVRSTVSSITLAGALVGVCALAVGCGDDGDDGGPPPDAMLSPTCAEATQHSDLDWIQENIITPSCAGFSVCHQGAAGAARGLNLEVGNTFDNMVNIPSDAYPDQTLVVPGSPETSYLMVVLGSYEGPQLTSGTMPPNNPILCEQSRQAIERWILSIPPP